MQLKMVFTLLVWNFKLRSIPKSLARFDAHEKVSHVPQHVYIRLEEIKRSKGLNPIEE